MMKDCFRKSSSELNRHKELVTLISEESELLEKIKSPIEKKRHKLIFDFLIELQCITSKGLRT